MLLEVDIRTAVHVYVIQIIMPPNRRTKNLRTIFPPLLHLLLMFLSPVTRNMSSRNVWSTAGVPKFMINKFILHLFLIFWFKKLPFFLLKIAYLIIFFLSKCSQLLSQLLFCFILNAVTVVAYRGKVVMEKRSTNPYIFFFLIWFLTLCSLHLVCCPWGVV